MLRDRLGMDSVVLLAACSSGPSSPPAKPLSVDAGRLSADTAADAWDDGVLVKIDSFDCEKLDDLPGFPRPTGPVTHGILDWHGGGPNGANWNVGDLRCVVRVSASCWPARLAVVVRVAARVAAAKSTAVTARGPLDVEIDVSQRAWNRNLDDEPKANPRRPPFRTAVFRASAEIDCQDRPGANINESRFPEVAAERSFVAGFASGE